MTRDETLLRTHREHLERFRSTMNLVGPGPIKVHYQDCELALDALNDLPVEGKWADLGTGAGFPGIVFGARFPTVRLDLVESRAKRCWFLDQVLGAVDRPQIQVLRMRHEDLEPGYDGVLSRALHAPERMLGVARRLVALQGVLVLFLQEDAPVPAAADFEMFHVKHYEVDGKRRKCAVLRKVS